MHRLRLGIAMLATFGMACAVSACASSNWVPGPGSGLQPEDYERDHALCSDEARIEVPNTAYDNDKVARMQAYRACLKRRGWVLE